ncbi:MAG: PIN domain-containing protein [Candidatus Dojkabacteria bacterium]|nr:MAG: PIN domain-containing protein [Candidatus Dojkabacteria bacterium]
MSRRKKSLIDTNILLRFLTQDVKSQADAAERLFESSEDGSLFIPDLVVAEIVFILQSSAYGKDRGEIAQIISGIANFKKFDLDRTLILRSIDIYQSSALSFTDSYIVAHAQLGRNDTVYTFDRKMHRSEPSSVKIPS